MGERSGRAARKLEEAIWAAVGRWWAFGGWVTAGRGLGCGRKGLGNWEDLFAGVEGLGEEGLMWDVERREVLELICP